MANIEEALKIAVDHLKEVAKYECYVMCSCKDDAQYVLDKIEELLKENSSPSTT